MNKPPQGELLSLFFRNLFFTVLQPGLVAGVFPCLIAGRINLQAAFAQFNGLQGIGLAFFLPGFGILVHCIALFALKGRGTLSPADPTKKLVVSGLYRFSRNPMYVGVLLMLAGEAIFFESARLGAYALFVFVVFHLFVRFVEEPRLTRDFGNAYLDYCQKVSRWV